MRRAILTLALVAAAATPARAEWQLKPFLGITFAGRTTLIDVDEAADNRHMAVGGAVVLLGEVLGIEADFGYTPGLFEGGRGVVVRSSAWSLTGNIVVALPRRVSEYSLRPYAVAGFGLLRASTDDVANVLPLDQNLAAFDVGAGVTGFLTERLGVSWDLRYFRSLGQPEGSTLTSIGDPQLSFWRANIALAIRY